MNVGKSHRRIEGLGGKAIQFREKGPTKSHEGGKEILLHELSLKYAQFEGYVQDNQMAPN